MSVPRVQSIFLAKPTEGDPMTVTEVCILTWAVLGMIAVAILLRYPERRREHRGENRN
jgi:hypothetical protein